MYDRHSELFRHNMELLGQQDIVIASTGGAGQSYLGNLLQELGLNQVDPYTESLDPRGHAVPVHSSWRRRLAATQRRDDGGRPRRMWPRFVKSEESPEVTLRRRVRGICLLVRDPRDALYSRYRFRRDFAQDPWALGKGSFGAWLESAYPGGDLPVREWIRFYRGWLDAGARYDRVLVARFEELKTSPGALRAFLRFAGVQVPEPELRRAWERSRFEVMRAHEDTESGGREGARILRSGTVGEWREWLTPKLWKSFSGADLAAVARELGYRIDYE
ncbi:sulfotransferase domain-containing protein [Amycolatopsis sp.]|uniref:sulfotransferase domain-containing protein n=1 Tax=Amycolatopsis sp. TaxID=37632 RepID=UPI002B9B1200|nr:sulfotransferase domain-containing protein [Amycolatopsis sp.]HVV08912.1 sulfotransferase domain-containing protein [Amycolatopsis sp.]